MSRLGWGKKTHLSFGRAGRIFKKENTWWVSWKSFSMNYWHRCSSQSSVKKNALRILTQKLYENGDKIPKSLKCYLKSFLPFDYITTEGVRHEAASNSAKDSIPAVLRNEALARRSILDEERRSRNASPEVKERRRKQTELRELRKRLKRTQEQHLKYRQQKRALRQQQETLTTEQRKLRGKITEMKS